MICNKCFKEKTKEEMVVGFGKKNGKKYIAKTGVSIAKKYQQQKQ